jgi:chromate reductase
MQQPEVYIGDISHVFDAEGNVIKEDTKGFLAKFMESFAKWVERNGIQATTA